MTFKVAILQSRAENSNIKRNIATIIRSMDTSSDGTLYDIVVFYPTDVQFDYTKYTDGMPESYKLLYDSAEDVIKTLKGSDGTGEFILGGGTKGEDLYGDVLLKHVKAIKEKWNANRLEKEGMSPEYYALSLDGENVLDKVGYAYYNGGGGIENLYIGLITDGDKKGFCYDIYTMVDRHPAHVISGTARNRYYALGSGILMNEHSDGANAEGWDTYYIEPNSTNLTQQVSFKIDRYENEKKPWFISYDDGETWENKTEKEFKEQMANFSDNMRLHFTPLSTVSDVEVNTESAENSDETGKAASGEWEGVFGDEELMDELDIVKRKDGTYNVDYSIYRLASLHGRSTKIDGNIMYVSSDSNEGAAEFKIDFSNMDDIRVNVTKDGTGMIGEHESTGMYRHADSLYDYLISVGWKNADIKSMLRYMFEDTIYE